MATRGDALAHLREELPLGLRLAGQLDEGRLERVQREVDVGVPLVVVALRLAEPLLHHLRRERLRLGRPPADLPPDLLARDRMRDHERRLVLDGVLPAHVGLAAAQGGDVDRVVRVELQVELEVRALAERRGDDQVQRVGLDAERAVHLLGAGEAALPDDVVERELAVVARHIEADALGGSLGDRGLSACAPCVDCE